MALLNGELPTPVPKEDEDFTVSISFSALIHDATEEEAGVYQCKVEFMTSEILCTQIVL